MEYISATTQYKTAHVRENRVNICMVWYDCLTWWNISLQRATVASFLFFYIYLFMENIDTDMVAMSNVYIPVLYYICPIVVARHLTKLNCMTSIDGEKEQSRLRVEVKCSAVMEELCASGKYQIHRAQALILHHITYRNKCVEYFERGVHTNNKYPSSTPAEGIAVIFHVLFLRRITLSIIRLLPLSLEPYSMLNSKEGHFHHYSIDCVAQIFLYAFAQQMMT